MSGGAGQVLVPPFSFPASAQCTRMLYLCRTSTRAIDRGREASETRGAFMYRIEHKGALRLPRVISEDGINAAEFSQLARALQTQPRHARKLGRVAARRADGPETIETRWNGKETENRAAPGDWIVTALAPDDHALRDGEGHLNAYVISGDRFTQLYERAPAAAETPHGALFQRRGTVEALRIVGGFEIRAPWGEMQFAPDGWLLLSGGEVYGNHHETFARTYELLD